MKKLVQYLLCITVFSAIIFTGISAIAQHSEIPGNLENKSPVISEKVKQKAEAGEEVAVLIKLKEEWEHPSAKRMTTAADPARFISKQDIKKLQKALEISFTPEEITKDIKIIHKLDNIPWITSRINLKAFEKLKVHSNVALIAEDTKVKPHLEESGPIINSDVVHLAGYTGIGVTVAVIDSGIDTDHPDLQNDLVWEECFSFGGGCPVTGGTRASGSGSAEDGFGHGTHVSGIITSGHATYKGIAPDTKIVALKVLDDTGSGWSSDIIAAIDWIVSNKDIYDISVVNMSLGSVAGFSGICDSLFSAESAAAEAAKAAGIVLFASSGNEAYTGSISTPACLSSVISVGAVYDDYVGGIYWGVCIDTQTNADKIACFSNVSSELDLLAPGSMIDSSSLGGGIVNYSGTSMASPHAAALASLMFQKNPFLAPDDIENILKSSGAPVYDARIGLTFPRVEAVGALNFTPDPSYTFNLTLNVVGTGSGTVTGAGTYNYGDAATVAATPDSGSAFDGWSGPDAAECTAGLVSMVANKSCTATFTLDNCPADPLKNEPGICGCGVADTDTDSDGTPDCNDLDDDNDGMPDDYELSQGFDPYNALDANYDPDGDGLTNLDEYNLSTDPHDNDTDDDGVDDGFDGFPLDEQQSSCPVPIRNDFTGEVFTSVAAAIDDPNAADFDTIQFTGAYFIEDVFYDRNIILTLSGGYYCTYSDNPSTSAINSMTISNGTVIVENIVIRTPSCDSSNILLCSTQSDCTAAGGYWWSDNTCLGLPESETVVSTLQRIWMDRNLGASRLATGTTDEEAYGDLYQWGRGSDGHQLRDSGTTPTTSSTDDPGHGDFITTSNLPFDWRIPQNDSLWQGVSGINNPCPMGFRLPTGIEWETERLSWTSNDAAGAFASPLKLVTAGFRYPDGSIDHPDGGYGGVTDHRNIGPNQRGG